MKTSTYIRDIPSGRSKIRALCLVDLNLQSSFETRGQQGGTLVLVEESAFSNLLLSSYIVDQMIWMSRKKN